MGDTRSLWEVLPPDLIQHILVDFGDGKSISTLLCTFPTAMNVAKQVVQKRLLSFASEASMDTRNFITQVLERNEQDRIQYISESLAIMDYFDLCTPQSFPIWVGSLLIQSTAPRVSIKVQVTTPFWNPLLVQQWSRSMGNMVNLTLDVRNFTTAPPIGVVKGVRDLDQQVLAHFVERMDESQFVVLESRPHRSKERELGIFFTTEKQARIRTPSYSAGIGGLEGIVDTSTSGVLYCLWSRYSHDVDYENDGDVESTEGQVSSVTDSLMNLMDRLRTSGRQE
mmetsp:Transcript_13745/g.31976  ORF Transcript_13745/g.31976 Transcript_13745/m.31976 type:complete len:282 (+) Transcript_13745:215-1060(+)|eukprot:CAMPEP_0116840180 /NCGR_PEP_ID=MMETSP0418-20121206/10189_1 /TAXON_ID=1158023 /ORGANISM="Astrosyne radiata, Strain 13vi08-1A" /LENGTH=281 /DNA_ID=CAMNT_0004470393 /DNA_START=208 /DNA_END=1053 /DNA_ORIENTATION=-